MPVQYTPLNAMSLNATSGQAKTADQTCHVQEFARLDGAVNLSVIANVTPEEFVLSGVDCNG